MIQWVGMCLTLVGLVYNGYQQYRQNTSVRPSLTIQQSAVQSTQSPRFYQAVYDSATNKFHVLGLDGVWYEQVPQIRTDQTQHSSPVGNWQGSQSAPLGQRDARQSSQASTNPWFR